jgi:diadenosine tetraphosphatase ApaH/serine/threonine PP2A family protein phosphatase
MRFAVISDIHANREALEAVLADIQRWQPDAVYCLGDVIGYGPEPGAVIDLLLKNAITSVRGNHELAVMTPRFLKWFNPIARVSIEKTIGLLRPGEVAAISRFPPVMSAHRCRFVHGFPPRSSLVYQFQVADPKKCRIMSRLQEPVCFVGHTHTLELISIEGNRAVHQELAEDDYQLDRQQKHIINIGSVGQPRDGNLQAKYVLFTPRDYRLKVCFVDYDAQATVDRMRQDGWPEQHALRLLPRPACS